MKPRTTILLLISVLLLSIAGNAQNSTQRRGEPDRLAKPSLFLIRCAPNDSTPGYNAPCFRFETNVLDEQDNVASLPSSAKIKVVQTQPVEKDLITLLNRNMDEGATSTAIAPQGKRYILLLFDVSGSMKEPAAGSPARSKFDAAKDSAAKILKLFRKGSDYVAIVPFDSVRVADPFRTAKFEEDATSQLENIRQSNGDTALFSAIVNSLDALQRKDPSASKALIAMTDGKNDVAKADPAERLSSEIKDALDKISKTQIPVYTIGFGQPGDIDDDAMRQLGSKDYFPATNQEALSKAFVDIGESLMKTFRVTALLEDATSFGALVGKTRLFQVVVENGNKTLKSPEREYTPPSFGVPSTDLVADQAEADAYFAKFKDTDTGSGSGVPPEFVQIGTFIFYVLVIAILWFLLPKALWPNPEVAGAGSASVTQRIEPIAPRRPAPNPSPATPPPQPAMRASAAAAKPRSTGTFVGTPGGTPPAGPAAGGASGPVPRRAPMDKTKMIRPEGPRVTPRNDDE